MKTGKLADMYMNEAIELIGEVLQPSVDIKTVVHHLFKVIQDNYVIVNNIIFENNITFNKYLECEIKKRGRQSIEFIRIEKGADKGSHIKISLLEKRLKKDPLFDSIANIHLKYSVYENISDIIFVYDTEAKFKLNTYLSKIERAKKLIFKMNCGLVYKVASLFLKKRLPLNGSETNKFELLSQFGMEGLLIGINRFDYTMGVSHAAYFFTFWIKRAIINGIAEEAPFPSVPSSDSNTESAEDTVAKKQFSIRLGGLLTDALTGALSTKEVKVIKLRFGIGGDGKPHTLEEIGQAFNGKCRSWAWREYTRAFNKILIKNKVSGAFTELFKLIND